GKFCQHGLGEHPTALCQATTVRSQLELPVHVALERMQYHFLEHGGALAGVDQQHRVAVSRRQACHHDGGRQVELPLHPVDVVGEVGFLGEEDTLTVGCISAHPFEQLGPGRVE